MDPPRFDKPMSSIFWLSSFFSLRVDVTEYWITSNIHLSPVLAWPFCVFPLISYYYGFAGGKKVKQDVGTDNFLS